MARRARKGRRRAHGPGGGGHDGPDERWLLTYADMITLLMALFIVMWSMSTVNISKFEALSASLTAAFSGKILPGGEAIQQRGADSGSQQAAPQPPLPAIQPPQQAATSDAGRRAQEDEEFRRIKAAIDAYARSHGLQDELQARIARRGLVVRLLTDNVLFASGQATLQPRSQPLLRHIATAVRRSTAKRPLLVEGHTDSVPISGSAFPTNWELSTARATSVVRYFLGLGMSPRRVGAAGYAYVRPVASNATAPGRARNRRVEIVLLRQGGGATDQGGTTP